MAWEYNYDPKINLFVEGKIFKNDAKRQQKTAIEILKRLRKQPGIILADEVGMGKTFVALAVAISVALTNGNKKPVVIMIPPVLKNKWPNDFNVFTNRCLQVKEGTVNCAVAETKLGFLKLLDDEGKRRKHVIFLTHGALYREKLSDKWVKIAIIQRALKNRKDADSLRQALFKYLGKILQLNEEKKNPDIIKELLLAETKKWKSILVKSNIFTEHDDDPIPKIIHEILHQKHKSTLINDLFKSLDSKTPRRNSKHFDKNIQDSRLALNETMSLIWKEVVGSMSLSLPLLIFDEAHHLKNADTQVASLFKTSDSLEDAEQVRKGFLANIFERMLFLTATPFQLGHHELCSVLDRFNGIDWNGPNAPIKGQEFYKNQLNCLRSTLDIGQEAALRLDKSWGDLKEQDLEINNVLFPNVDVWWAAAKVTELNLLNSKTQTIRTRLQDVKLKLKKAENHLKPFVIRHMKPRYLDNDPGKVRRLTIPGEGIVSPPLNGHSTGLKIDSSALFPFLLAARLTACTPQNRPVFAEGLSSSFEAFRQTRKRKKEESVVDEEDYENPKLHILSPRELSYLAEIDNFLVLNSGIAWEMHPKIAATVDKVKELWLKGEKVLVFCHYIETGKALRQYISKAIKDEISRKAIRQLKCDPDDVWNELERIGTHFEGAGMRLRKVVEQELLTIISKYPSLEESASDLMDIFKRYLKTPSFLVRYFPLEDTKLNKVTFRKALRSKDSSQMSLIKMINDFLSFLAQRCEPEERERYIKALLEIQPGGIRTKDVSRTYSEEEIQDQTSDIMIGNVRLVNGSTKDATRQRLMLTFNTPFYPDILVASSVMAEGVDLHLNCRHIIHHDLCWNPSTLEQRTGRIDRIGAKVETCKLPIEVYLPYIGETQDEKMYRVVMDRERWFKVVMGEKYSVDSKTTEKLANRIPLPLAIAEELMFKLEAGSSIFPSAADWQSKNP
jgi:ERCC4-related helicase